MLKVLKGLDKQMLLEFGEDALAKIQALPWSTSHLDAFQSTLTSGEKLPWQRAKCDMCHCMLAFALGVACRKEESPRDKRSNVAWFTARLVEVVLDKAGIESLCNACFCRVRPVSSKTDQNNVDWGNHYMWFRVDTSAWWSLAAALMWIEQTHFVEPQHRLTTTLFFNPEVAGFVPFSLSVMAVMLNELMVAGGIIVATASVYDRFTWHSARVTLACQLRKLKYGWDRITSHLRHKSAESARIYGRLDAIGYADTAENASRADASGILAADLPDIDPVAKHAGMTDAIAAMEAMVIGETEKPRERVQDTAEREALEELAAEAKAAKAKQKRKATQQAAQEDRAGKLQLFDVGESAKLEAHTTDSWGLVGRDVSIPNAAWRGELDDGCVSVCRVVGLAPRRYVVSAGGHCYTFTVAHLRLYLQDAANESLLQDLGGVTAIKGAPTTQVIGTQAQRKAVSRRGSTPATRLVLAAIMLLGLACGGQSADPGGSEDPDDAALRGRPLAPHGDAELLATLQVWAARDRAAVTASPQALRLSVRALTDVSEAGSPFTIEQHIRQQDVAAQRVQAELVQPPRQRSQRRPGWAVAAGHTPNLDTLQYWNEQWLHSALWYDDPRFDDDAEARAWRVVEAHAAGLSRWQGVGTRHMCSDTDDYVPTYSRPAWEEVSFNPEDGDVFDEWLNGGDDGRQEAAWEAAIAVWDRDFLIGQGRQRDRMFCVVEYMLRMPHGDSYSNDAAWMVILADAAFSDVREAVWLRRIIARRISAAARRRWRPPSFLSSAEKVKRHRRDDDSDPSGGGSGGKGAAGGFCVATIGSA